MINMKALFRKRFFLYKRSPRTLAVEILIPLILVIIGLSFTKVSFFFQSPPRTLLISEYPWEQRLLLNNETIVGTNMSISPQVFFENFDSSSSAYDATYMNYSGYNFTDILPQFDSDNFDMSQNDL